MPAQLLQVPCAFSTPHKSGLQYMHSEFKGDYGEKLTDLEAFIDLQKKTLRITDLFKNQAFDRTFKEGEPAVYCHDTQGIWYGPIVGIAEKSVLIFKKSGVRNIPDKNRRLPLYKFIDLNWEFEQARADEHN